MSCGRSVTVDHGAVIDKSIGDDHGIIHANYSARRNNKPKLIKRCRKRHLAVRAIDMGKALKSWNERYNKSVVENP
jgi:altronate dehydratase